MGVAFNLLVALRSRLRQQGVYTGTVEPDIREWLDLVALGTIADVVPLVEQNRLYVLHGLKLLATGARPGVNALKKAAGITDGSCSCGQVGFRMAPRLNAAGRLESAVPGVELLLSGDPIECAGIAADLDAANAERQAIERTMLEDAIRMVEASGAYPDCYSIVLASGSWHQGVVGIVASRIVERYHRPTILIAIGEDGVAKGSGRSISGFHLLEALTECAPLLDRFGGHRYAAGVGLPDVRINEFCLAFETSAKKRLQGMDLRPTLAIDTEVQPEQLVPGLVEELKRLEPFGSANPEPTLMLRNVAVIDKRIVGDSHLKLRLRAAKVTFSAIAFRMGDREVDAMLDVAFFPELNVWNGKTELQLRIKDFRKAE